MYEYIRGDAQVNTYQKFVANSTYFKSLKNCKIRYNIVVQNLNVHQIALIYNNFDKSEINFIILLGPVLLQANHIPEENKIDIVYHLIIEDEFKILDSDVNKSKENAKSCIEVGLENCKLLENCLLYTSDAADE